MTFIEKTYGKNYEFMITFWHEAFRQSKKEATTKFFFYEKFQEN